MIQETALPVEGASPRAAIPIGEGLTFATVAAPAMFPLSTATSKVYRHDDGIGQAPHGSNPSWVVARCPEASPNPHPWKALENRDRRKTSITLPWSCIWFYAWLCVFYSPAFSLKPQAQPPNIVLILADDLGYGDLGAYNPESRIPTPHLDRLADQGMRFTDAHSPSTVCTPTRYSILTGRMAFRTGFPGVFDGAGGPCLIESGRLTLPGMLRDQGYRTACYGKWHVGLTFFDSQGAPIHQNGLKAVQKIDYTRAIPDGPIHRGFDAFW